MKNIVVLSLCAAVLGVGVVGYGVSANHKGAQTADTERSAVETCFPKVKRMNASDETIHANILLYRKTIEIAKSTSNESLRQQEIQKWAKTDYIKYIDTLPLEEQGKIFALLEAIRADDNAGSCLIGKVQ